MSRRDLKIIAATLTVVGAVLSILDRIYAPELYILADSPKYPGILRTLGWLFLLIPPLIYIGLDWRSLFQRKVRPKEAQNED